ncbi:MAG: hypothetical protein ACYCVL_00075 [Gemmatimonadaceae bacterium]
MSDLPIIETIYGKSHKFDIVKDSGGVFGSIKFYIHKDGKPFKGSYASLAAAVEAAKDEG